MTSSSDAGAGTTAATFGTNGPWRACVRGRFTGGMFVGDEVMLDISFPSARVRLESLTRGGLLISASDDAYGEEITGLMRVGPAGLSRLVRVQFRDLSERANTAGFALRWEVTRPGGGLFPVLDADVELIQAGPQSTWLTIAGAYRPPLGALGEALDRAILHRVATATIRGFLSRIATGITGEPEPGEMSAEVPNAGIGPASAPPVTAP
jgi:hypothetical protein